MGRLIKCGFGTRGVRGISPINLLPGLANQLGVPVSQEVLAVQVVADSGAAQTALQAQGVILNVGMMISAIRGAVAVSD